MHHFKSIGEFKLKLQSGNAQNRQSTQDTQEDTQEHPTTPRQTYCFRYGKPYRKNLCFHWSFSANTPALHPILHQGHHLFSPDPGQPTSDSRTSSFSYTGCLIPLHQIPLSEAKTAIKKVLTESRSTHEMPRVSSLMSFLDLFFLEIF